MNDTKSLYELARRLADPGVRISMADHAALRRMQPLAPGPAALPTYSLLSEVGVALDNADSVRRWTVIAHALALARGGHEPARKIGTALVEMKFSEARLAQLVSADFDLLSDIIPRLARRLNSQSPPRMDFAPLMRLLLTVDRDLPEAERARLEIARSFVLATHLDRESRKSS